MVKTRTTASAGAFNTSTPEYDYWSEAHSLAAEQLEFAIRSMILLTVFTGEAGSGKSTVLRKVLAKTQHKQLVGVISHDATVETNPALAILKALGAEVDPDAEQHVHESLLRQSLGTTRNEHGLATVIIDDADRFPGEVISNVFRLAGFRTGDDAALFKVILIGQPDLRDRLSKSIYDLLGPSIELEPMSEADTAGYIKHRLKTAHSDGVPFTEDALKAAHEQTGGRPSLINLLCKSALITARTLGLDQIDAKLVGNGASVAHALRHDEVDRVQPPAAQPAAKPPAVKSRRPAAPEPTGQDAPAALVLRPKTAETGSSPDFRSKRDPENGRTRTPTAPTPSTAASGASGQPPNATQPQSQHARPITTEPDTAPTPSAKTGGTPLGTWVLASGAAAGLAIAAYVLFSAGTPPLIGTGEGQAEKVTEGTPIPTAPETATLPQALEASLPETPVVVASADASRAVADPAGTQMMREVMAAIGGMPEGSDDWYRRGITVADQSPLAAVAAYAVAAEGGHARAAYYLGQMYETGEGIPADKVLARHWYGRAGTQIEPAIARMNALAAPDSDGAISPAIPLFAITAAKGEAILGWTSAEGADPVAYEIGFADATGTLLPITERLESSVLRMALPDRAAYWRVSPVAPDGRAVDPTGWLPLDLAATGN